MLSVEMLVEEQGMELPEGERKDVCDPGTPKVFRTSILFYNSGT